MRLSAPLPTVLRAALCALALLLPCADSLAAAGAPDPITLARRLYNEGKFDEALDAARKALATPATASSARLVMGRIQLEQYRRTPTETGLDEAKSTLRAVDARALDQRERIELQVGLATLLYYEDRFGAAAELLDPVVDSSATLAPDAHERALEWWATALDRQAQAQPAGERTDVYLRIAERMEQQLRRGSGSGPASYWLAAAARGAGDIERAWSAAIAGWIRASLAPDRGATLKADLDRLVTTAIIPDRAARLPARERKQALTSMAADWEHFKRIW
jgi:tetratricopeptide (TPR) repeat protein